MPACSVVCAVFFFFLLHVLMESKDKWLRRESIPGRKVIILKEIWQKHLGLSASHCLLCHGSSQEELTAKGSSENLRQPQNDSSVIVPPVSFGAAWKDKLWDILCPDFFLSLLTFTRHLYHLTFTFRKGDSASPTPCTCGCAFVFFFYV